MKCSCGENMTYLPSRVRGVGMFRTSDDIGAFGRHPYVRHILFHAFLNSTTS